MGTLAYESDTAFFNLIHRLVVAEQKKAEKGDVAFDEERRELPRNAYHGDVLMAPGFCGTVPPLTAFAKVRSFDLSTRGFAFLYHQHPNFDQFVALFRVPSPIYVTSRLTFSRQVWVDSRNKIHSEQPAENSISKKNEPPKGKFQFLIGSEFVHRLTDTSQTSASTRRLLQ